MDVSLLLSIVEGVEAQFQGEREAWTMVPTPQSKQLGIHLIYYLLLTSKTIPVNKHDDDDDLMH